MERSARAEHQDPQFVNPRFFVKFQARPANVAIALYRVSDQFLVSALAIGVRAVEKVDADLTRTAQGVDRGISVGLIVERRHRRATETDRGNLESEGAGLHPNLAMPQCSCGRM